MTNHTLNRIGVMHNMESWVKLCVGYLDFYSGGGCWHPWTMPFYLAQHLIPKRRSYGGPNKLVYFSVYFVFRRRLGINYGIAKRIFPRKP
jgi:hypothetical protein